MTADPWSFLKGSTFTREQVLMLLGEQRPHRETVTLFAAVPGNPYKVVLQRTDKSPDLLLPGGAPEGEESLIAAVWREAVQEHPNLERHLLRDTIAPFTVCRVVPTHSASDAQFLKPLSKFFAGSEVPDAVMEFLQAAMVPLYLGTDHVFFGQLEGEIDLREGVSEEAKEMHLIDLRTKPALGYFHATLAAEYIEFIDSGFIKRPSLDKVYRRAA